MPAFYIAPEASIKYTLTNPSGVRAVLNDPSDPDFCGYLDGEEAITGIDSPEIRDSYADLADNDGGVAGTNFYARRPIVMNGRIIPTSAADRNAKLGKLMEATDSRFADGELSWTPTGGEEVFLKVRRQLPFRAKGGFNKEFQIGLVANDPRIYTRRTIHAYTETNGNSNSQDYRRFAWASGSNTLFASRQLYLPPGVWKVSIPVKSSVNSRTITAGLSNSTGTATPLTLSTAWQTVTRTLTTANPAGTPTDLTLVLDSSLTSGQYIEVGDPILESSAGLTIANNAAFASNWVTNANYTLTFQTSSPPTYTRGNPGNAVARPIQRVIGPFDVGSPAINAFNYVTFDMASALSSSDYLVIDYANRTILKNNTTNVFADSSIASPWGGVRPWAAWDPPIFYNTSGATTATRQEFYYRGTFL